MMEPAPAIALAVLCIAVALILVIRAFERRPESRAAKIRRRLRG